MKWPYKNELNQIEEIKCDVLVLGGGLSGCFAAIAAKQKGLDVVVVEKGEVSKSGAGGTGFDHFESACTNPCSKVSPEEIAYAYIDEQDHFSNGIFHYITCREGYDRLLDLERFGGKIRDTEDEFLGARFRDEKTKLMFAYDYENKFTLRVWGTTFKPALVNEMKRLGVRIFNHVEATALLTKMVDDKKIGVGAIGNDTHTSKMYVFNSKSTILAMSRPSRVWLFDSDMPGQVEFRPFQSIGSGHAMGFRSGLAFTMMEKTVKAEFSSSGKSFPPYGTGNNHNTWYAATMVDARGKEIPYLDRDGNILEDYYARYYPAKGQKFFLKGGVIDNPKYEYRGPETMEFEQLMERGYKLPFYADLSKMPKLERKVLWGMMVGQEAKTNVPVLKNYTDRGFDPNKHLLQSYGNGWKSASFLGQERQFFGAPGGVFIDWDLKTNIDGIYACGDSLFGADCAGSACATGYYAGRKAANSSINKELISYEEEDVKKEFERIYKPYTVLEGYSWKELNKAISKLMQNYCGEVKADALLDEGLNLLNKYEEEIVPKLKADNPHDLVRIHEVMDILTVAKLVIYASKERKNTNTSLSFERGDYPLINPIDDRLHNVIHLENNEIVLEKVPLDYYGDLKKEYELRNSDYIRERENYDK